MNEFVYNNMKSAANAINKLKMANIFRSRDVVIVSDEHELAYSLCGALCFLKHDIADSSLHLIGTHTHQHTELINELKDIYSDFTVWDSLDAYLDAFNRKVSEEEPSVSEEDVYRDIIFDFANLRDPMYADIAQRNKKENEIKRLLDHCLQYPGNLFQLITCIPPIKEPLPDVTNAVAEREYEVLFRDYPQDSLEKFVLHLENCMRCQKDLLSRIQVVRLDRVFGPGITSDDGIWVMDILRDMFTNHSVTIYDRDRHDFASASYSRDAVIGILLAMANGRKGNIYHISSWELSRYQIISTLYDAFPENSCTLETVHEGWTSERQTEYRMLNARKLLLTHRSNLTKVLRSTKLWALRSTAEWYLNGEPYCPKNEINLYYGRMPRIRELLLELLKEVDKICKENDIQYFLSAGTMLGAVRHHGFIPWDDDIDICMLPKDYEKFLSVCPEHLSVDYGYQNFSTEPESHYIHDKIRIKNTFFSTKYSNKYPMMNGVYIDVFVYYKTADSPAAQKRHLNQVDRSRKLIALHWATQPKIQAKKTRLVRILYPIVKKIPFSWIHKYNQYVLKKYENKNTHYRFDSTGFNLKKVGAVPDEWFHGTVEVDFCGEKFPIPAHYDDYLRHWFGDDYMNLLPVSSRASVHDVIRIDLGQYLFDETKHDPRFRDVDIRGELFEQIPESDKTM